MDNTEDFSQLDAPAFLAERRRVRAVIEGTPPDEQSPELLRQYEAMDAEFLRRASLAWAAAQ
jgi:hypothetical protein